jgi:hypothetical protein
MYMVCHCCSYKLKGREGRGTGVAQDNRASVQTLLMCIETCVVLLLAVHCRKPFMCPECDCT